MIGPSANTRIWIAAGVTDMRSGFNSLAAKVHTAQLSTAQDALEGFTGQMKTLPAFLRESLTHDRGSEMRCHVELARRLNLDIWFADPHAPWQLGSNENTNGLLRQFPPKGADLSGVT